MIVFFVLGGYKLKLTLFIVLLGVSLITTACSPTNEIIIKEKEIEKNAKSSKDIKSSPVTATIDKEYEFTYLEDLPMDKLEKYNLFLEDENINHLIDFTPEQIVLIYMNLVLREEVDKIFVLTADNGQLPTLDIFRDEYHRYLSSNLHEDYLKYRFYDSIAIDHETKINDQDIVVVKMEIIYGSVSQGITYALLKENNVWKMDLYHIVDTAKKKND